MRDRGFSAAEIARLIGALLSGLVIAGSAAGAASAGAVRHDQVLSNETTFTRWAYVNRIAWIYRAPSTASPRVGRLTWDTPDQFTSSYLLLRAHWDRRGQEWVRLRVPGRPNGTTRL